MKVTKSSGFVGLLLVLLVAVLILGGAYFVANSSLLTTPTCECNETKICNEAAKPVASSILTNPIVYEWSGSVEGKLVSKDTHTFTLEDDKGNRITITDVTASGDIYKSQFIEATPGKKIKELTLASIPLQTRLRGDFWIFDGGQSIPVGGTFRVVK